MTTGYLAALRSAQLDVITTQVGSAGLLKLYDGTRPATGGTVTNLLATFTLGTPFAPAASAGVLSPNLPANTTGTAAGTATWFRITTSGAAFMIDGAVGTSGSDLNLNTTTISVGLTLSVTSFSISRGNA